MENFEKLSRLGTYTNGKGYRAIERETGKVVILKKRSVYEEDEGFPANLIREMSLHRTMEVVPEVLRWIRVEKGLSEKVDKRPYYCFVFEAMDVDLDNYLKTFSPLSPTNIKRLMYQLCKCVASCHRHILVLRDLKPFNLLINLDTMTLKIADIVLCHELKPPFMARPCEIFTLQYCAPELLLCDTVYHSYGLDMWSVGCIFAELVTNKALFQGDSKEKQLHQIFRLLGTPTDAVLPGVTRLKGWHKYPNFPAQELSSAVPGLDSDGLDLLSKMLHCHPYERISALEAMEHPYFSDLGKA